MFNECGMVDIYSLWALYIPFIMNLSCYSILFLVFLCVLPLCFMQTTWEEEGGKANEGEEHNTNSVSSLVCALLKLGEIVPWYRIKWIHTP